MADSKSADESRESSWEHAHEMLVGFARTRAGLDLEEGRWLLAAARERVDRRLGYASFVEYVERLFGYSTRLTQDKLRVAEALEGLPELARSLERAETCWSSVRELTRVATSSTEKAWLDVARGRTVRDVERLVSGRAYGSLPTDPADERLRQHVLRFEVSGDVLATFRDALVKLRRDAGGGLDDNAALMLMARYVLGGPVDEGRASYQVELSLCEDCGRARQRGGGELVQVAAPVVDMARCDAQRLPAHAHVGANTSAPTLNKTNARRRATQDIPPALRREVLRRDQRSCRVPGCRHDTFLDLHHIHARHEGGGHEADNLVTMCGAHHRVAHDGELLVTGLLSTGLRFYHADGSEYGAVGQLAATVADAQTKAFQALRHMGFGERDAKRALSEVLEKLGPECSVELRLRAALELLTAGVFRSAS